MLKEEWMMSCYFFIKSGEREAEKELVIVVVRDEGEKC
jgi:hypothetical protein